MNEKIKELYAKALSEAGEDGEAAMVEAFAELIVAECISVVNQNREWPIVAIKKHFGVEL